MIDGFVCPNCLTNSYSGSIEYLGVAKEFKGKKIVTCLNCGLKSAFPMPTDSEVSNYYNDYWAKPDVLAMSGLFEAQASSRYNFLEKFILRDMKIKVLDVGAGFGLLKKHFPLGTEYDAVEIDPDAIEFLANTIQAKSVYKTIEDATDLYDVIILSHILEHFKFPSDFMTQIRNKLTEGGIVFVEVPNSDYTYKTRNEPHLIFFEPETLVNLISRSGFNVLQYRTCGRKTSDLIKARKKSFRLIRQAVKRILPRFIVDKIIRQLSSASMTSLIDHTSEYGDGRQWIRLVANKAEK